MSERKLISKPEQATAREEFERFMRARRDGHVPPKLSISTTVLTDAIKAIGRARYVHIHVEKTEPTEVLADPTTWQILDVLSTACYGQTFADYLGRQWWPTSKPPRPVVRVERSSMEPQEFRVA